MDGGLYDHQPHRINDYELAERKGSAHWQVIMTISSDANKELRIFKPMPDLPAPLDSVSIIGWVKKHLFSSKINSLLTIAALILLCKTIPPLFSWAILDATWSFSSTPCPADLGSTETIGACWTFIVVKFRVLMVGLYPEQFLWHPIFSFAIFILVCVLTTFRVLQTRFLILLWFFLPLPLFFLINGGMGLEIVDRSLWGGLMSSIGLAVIGILMSIHLGILFALGRRSKLVAVKSLCIGIIESIRGVPLITILFMASVLLPVFLPQGMNINNLLRVQVGIILFSSAYL